MSFQHTIKIPKDRIGAIIGKSGKVKQQIEKRCGVEIAIDSESGEATITGKKPIEEMEAFRAVEVITAISRGFSPERAYRLFENEEILFQQVDLHDYAGRSPNALERIKGRIIGEGGKARRAGDLTRTQRRPLAEAIQRWARALFLCSSSTCWNVGLFVVGNVFGRRPGMKPVRDACPVHFAGSASPS